MLATRRQLRAAALMVAALAHVERIALHVRMLTLCGQLDLAFFVGARDFGNLQSFVPGRVTRLADLSFFDFNCFDN